MLNRCKNPSQQNYAYYGGRGITVCAEWRRSFQSFLAHVGRRPTAKHSIDRIDNMGDYEPGNVRWATIEEQSGNRRGTRRLTYQGETLSLSAWGRRLAIHQSTLHRRIVELGWPIERALTAPTDTYRRRAARH